MNKTHSLVSILATTVACVFTAVPAIAADTGASEHQVVVTDSRGRPPFKRARVSTSAEFARLEESTARSAGFRGRPPFARQSGDDEAAVDLARFEETTETRKRRPGPPGKGVRR